MTTTDTATTNGHKPKAATLTIEAASEQRKAARDAVKAKEKAYERSLKAAAKSAATHDANTAKVDADKAALLEAKARETLAVEAYEQAARRVNG